MLPRTRVPTDHADQADVLHLGSAVAPVARAVAGRSCTAAAVVSVRAARAIGSDGTHGCSVATSGQGVQGGGTRVVVRVVLV